MNKRINLIISAALLATAPAAMAQDAASAQQIVIQPLFEYPVAPDSITSFHDKSDYLVEHFWDQLDFKTKKTFDQNALNHAMSVYMTPLQFCSPEAAEKSINKLIAGIAGNQVLCLQFAKAAEENLYGPRSEMWSDDLYLKFIDPLLKNKKIKKERKARYQRQATLLQNTKNGAVPPAFDYQTPDGKTSRFVPNGVITVIEFGDPDCDECRSAKLRMDTDVKFNSLIDRGLVNVLFIYVDPEEGWQTKLSGYPSKWHVGASDEVGDLYDLRSTPSIYVIDREGKVALKNISVETAMSAAGIIATGQQQ